MLIKHINKNTFDLFFNNGWDNWARFELQGNKLAQVKGIQVPANITSFLNKRYCK